MSELKQSPNEDFYRYFTRCSAVVADFPKNPPAFPSATEPELVAVVGPNPEQMTREELMAAFGRVANLWADTAWKASQKCSGLSTLRQQAAYGVKESLRNVAWDSTEKNLRKWVNQVMAAELTRFTANDAKKGHNGNNKNGKKQQRIAAVEPSSDEEEDVVAAVVNKKKKKSSARCTFCNRNGHTVKDCRDMLKASKQVKANLKSNVPMKTVRRTAATVDSDDDNVESIGLVQVENELRAAQLTVDQDFFVRAPGVPYIKSAKPASKNATQA